MAQVVAFPAFAPRTARRPRTATRADGDGGQGKVIVFTGVWHERLEAFASREKRSTTTKPKK